MEIDQVGKIVSLLCAWWPNYPFTPDVTISGFNELFDEHQVTFEEARAALGLLVRQGKEFLSAPAIIAAVEEVRKAKAGKRTREPEEIWAALQGYAQRGIPGDVVKSRCSPAVWAAIVSVGGWHAMQYADTREKPHMRRAFIETLRGTSAANEKHHQAKQAVSATRSLGIGIESTGNVLRLIDAVADKLPRED